MGRVEAICIGAKKGEKKSPQPAGRFATNHGIEGDAHAGPWHRQVSLLAAEDIEAMRCRTLPDLEPGDFAENVVVSGVDLRALGLGSRVRLGGATDLTVTQLGKTCHQRCAIYYQAGDCIMPRLGLFARVLCGGTVRTGDAVEVLRVVPRKKLQTVILTAGAAAEASSQAVARLLETALQAHVYASETIPDDRCRIAERLSHYSSGHSIDAILVVGGTGFIPGNVEFEGGTRGTERRAAGLDEALRRTSSETVPLAVLSSEMPVIRHGSWILGLPGSERDSIKRLLKFLPALERRMVLGEPAA